MVAAKYLGLAFVVLVGCCAISEATIDLGGGGGVGVDVDIGLIDNLLSSVLSLVGQTLHDVLGLVGHILGNVFGLLNGLLGGLFGGSYSAGSFFGYGNNVPSDVSVFIGGVPTSNGAALDLFVKIFASMHPFFDKGCGGNFGALYFRALYVYATIIASSNKEYATGAKCVKTVSYNGDVTVLYENLKVDEIVAEWDVLVQSQGGDVSQISGPKGFAYQYANYLFLQLRNKKSYLDLDALIGGLLQSVFGLVGFAGHLVSHKVDGILGLLTNILGGLGLGSRYSGQFGDWTSTIVTGCNGFGDIDGQAFIGGHY